MIRTSRRQSVEAIGEGDSRPAPSHALTTSTGTKLSVDERLRGKGHASHVGEQEFKIVALGFEPTAHRSSYRQ
jgi:hypothetical protein